MARDELFLFAYDTVRQKSGSFSQEAAVLAEIFPSPFNRMLEQFCSVP
jgi:hypothetical protein